MTQQSLHPRDMRSNAVAHETSETRQSLWLLTAGPTIWAVHFVLSYATAAIWCAKVVGPGGSLATVRLAIGVYSALALIGIGIIGWIGYRRHRYREGPVPHDADTPEDRHRFLGFATFLLSALSGVAVLYAAANVIFFARCY
jgi:hypothetical protein